MILFNYDLQSLLPLHAAAGKGDTTELMRLLDLGIDIEQRTDTGTGYQDQAKCQLTPLMVAAGSVFDSVAAMRALLKRGANPCARSEAGVDALWYAAGTGDPERATMLLALGGDPHGVSNDGLSTIAQAAGSGNAETLQLLLDEGTSPHPPGGLDAYDTTKGALIPLFAAAMSGSAASVQVLLELGADATACDRDGRTALMHAGGPEVIPLLIAAGCPLNTRDRSGWSALDIALVDRAAVTMNTMRAAPNVSDMRVFEPDIQQRQIALVAGLLDAGIDLEATDEQGRTGLLRACQHAIAPALVERLIAHGAHIRAQDAEGRTALHLALHNADLMRLLVRVGIPVDVRDSLGCTPLHRASQMPHGSVDAIDTLLDLGAKIDAHTADGLTPLMLAASTDAPMDTPVTRLLAHGADPGARTPDGRTARDYAVEQIAALGAQIEALSGQTDKSGQLHAALATRRLALQRSRMVLAALDTAFGHATPQTHSTTPALPEPILLGYKLRSQDLVARYREYYRSKTNPIREICCFGHASWMTGANAATCYASEDAAVEAEEIAATVFPDEHDQPTEMYAYRAFPLVFGTSGVPHALQPSALLGESASEPSPLDDQRYTWLGYDVTECSLDHHAHIGSWSGCSPLSLGCNGIALEMGTLVNSYCLIDSVGAAYDLATLFGVEQPEPGPYVIVEVWRATKM